MSLKNQAALITGASMGIGAVIARRLAAESAILILFARSADKLKVLAEELKNTHFGLRVFPVTVDVQDHAALSTAVMNVVKEVGHIDILVNNAGLALGALNAFPDLKIQDIITMTSTNINGFMFATCTVLNEGKIKARGRGTILNITSTTGLKVPPFSGEGVYYASKACLEAFTNVLRTELVGTDIKVLALKRGVVATNFHEQSYDEFTQGFEPLIADDVAEAAAFMLAQKGRVSIKSLDVVPTA
ncbi:short chain dehydrogenase/ reductase-like protein [Phaeosphaeriaceae sp. PMI808]|nr:short chain dehydrogenase/ reductase-like protein [Phaeosphaeriaceae sp. PMI808]